MAGEAGTILQRAGFRVPTPLQQKLIPLILAGRDVLVEAQTGTGKTVALLCPLVLMLKAPKPAVLAVVLTQGPEELKKMQRQWRNLAKGAGSPLASVAIGVDDAGRKEATSLAQQPHVIFATPQRLIDHIRQGNVNLGDLRFLAADVPPQSPEFARDIEFILSKCPVSRQTVFVVSAVDEETSRSFGEGRQQVVLRAKDWQTVERPDAADQDTRKLKQPGRSRDASADRRNEVPNEAADAHEETGRAGLTVDEEGLKAAIKATLERITQVENPEEMNALKRIYRRNVPLHLRAYFSAYLLRELGGAKFAPRGGDRAAPRGQGRATHKREEREPAQGGGQKASGGAKGTSGKHARLFINAGRNRRIYPNDIYDLFTSQLQIDRAEMGEVRVLDNYSFVEIQTKHAERAIAELTGKELKGRKLTVDFARPREDKQRE